MTIFQTLYWAVPQWDYHCGTAPGRIFQAVAVISSIFSININVLTHSQATFGTKFKQILEKIAPAVLPYQTHGGTAPGGTGQCCNTLAFSLFYYFFVVFVVLVEMLSLCNTLRQLWVQNARTNTFENPVLDTVPVELPYWNCPWPRGAVLHYPCFLHLFMLLQ